MKILPLDNSNQLKGIIVEHNGDRIISDGCTFDRPVYPSTGELFMDINNFWSTLPEEQQAKIFRIYSDVQDCFISMFNDLRLHERMVALTTELYSCWNYADLARYVRLQCNVVIPDDISDDMGDYSSTDRTYLRDDYMGLLCLVTALRPMIPIWNLYMRETRKTAGTHFKEFAAIGLLNHTGLIDTAEFNKLRTYVSMSVDTSRITMSAIVGGVGSAELEEWVFGVVLTRKVALGIVMHTYNGRLLSHYDKSVNLIKNIFQTIQSTLTTMDRRFDGQVRKKPDGMDFRDDDKESLAEKIIVKQKINDYKFLLAWKYAQSVPNVRVKVDPSLPMELVTACIETLRRNNTFQPIPGQIALTQWAVNTALAARFIPALEQPERVNMMGLAQALYWHWGFYDLALLLTATPSVMDDGLVFGTETRTRPTTEQFRILREQYPYYHQRSGGKKGTGEQQRSENAAMIAIEKICSLFDGKPYLLNAPQELINLTTMRPYGSGGYLIPPDLKIQTAAFIIKLNNFKSGV